jgi:hypothetical protein
VEAFAGERRTGGGRGEDRGACPWVWRGWIFPCYICDTINSAMVNNMICGLISTCVQLGTVSLY